MSGRALRVIVTQLYRYVSRRRIVHLPEHVDDGPERDPVMGRVVDCERVALVRDALSEPGEVRDKFLFGELYPRLLGRPYATGGPDPMATVERLGAPGITPDVTPIRYDSGQPFEDLDEACDFWEGYPGLAPGAQRPFLPDFLADRLVQDGAGWLAPPRKRALVAWRLGW